MFQISSLVTQLLLLDYISSNNSCVTKDFEHKKTQVFENKELRFVLSIARNKFGSGGIHITTVSEGYKY